MNRASLMLTLLGFSIILLYTACDKIENPSPGYITGVVKAAVVDTSGDTAVAPLAGADVRTLPHHAYATTDSLGQYTLEVFPRTYRVYAKHDPIVVDTIIPIDSVLFTEAYVDTVYEASDTLIITTTVQHVLDSILHTETTVYDSTISDEYEVKEAQTISIPDIVLPAAISYSDSSFISIDTVSVDTTRP